MNNRLLLAVALAAFGISASASAQTVITQWGFDGASTPVAINNTPAPSIGSGSASTLGMTFDAGATSNADVTTISGTANMGTNNMWRVRGTGGTENNGWDPAAPIGSQGAQFLVSTAGYTGIGINFDVDITTKGTANLQVQYTIDGTTWVNALITGATVDAGTIATNTPSITIKNNTTSLNTVTGSYVQAFANADTFFNISANLSGVGLIGNDSNFGFRIVNASTGTDDVIMKDDASEVGNSGNWRFDNVAVTGFTAVPEPSTYGLMGAGALAAASFIRRRNAKRA